MGQSSVILVDTQVESRFVVLPISGRVCIQAMALPAVYPQDPAGRLIGATALVEGIPLVTAADDIRRSKALRTIWRAAELYSFQSNERVTAFFHM
jgi:PIN domain nuclease of toxin-antitoxin system